MASKKNDTNEMRRSSYDALSKKLTQLRTEKRLEIAKKLEEARAFGDLSENAEYTAAKDEQAKLEDEILRLETTLNNAKIVDEEKIDTTKAGIGLKVTLEDLDVPGKTYTYTLVGSEELAVIGISAGGMQSISQKSPVGQAITGHSVGEEVAVKIPRGTRHLKITAIEK
ncbi:MAG: transcription elongation factor GreA [Synergistaceae bacterium]|nr:transcription elongation factor GreA [Synergistaceae bacterium]